MFIKLLPEDKKILLLNLARLMALSDKPLLWAGKTKDELTADSDLSALSIQHGEAENELITELEQSISGPAIALFDIFPNSDKNKIENLLIEKLKAIPLSKIDAPEQRVQSALAVIKVLLENNEKSAPAEGKIMLLQLILISLRDGHISSIEWALLKEIQLRYQLPDFIFSDLLERAEALNSELSKTLSLVLE